MIFEDERTRILADTLKFASHCGRKDEKEDGSRSLGRSSDTVYYGGSTIGGMTRGKDRERWKGKGK